MTDANAFIFGELIEFGKGRRSVPDYKYNGLRSPKVSGDGSTTLSSSPNARVEGIEGEYVLVSYTDKDGNRPCLGFLPKYIKKAFTTWKNRYKVE